MKARRYRARVRFVVEVLTDGGSWSGEGTLDGVADEAVKDAQRTLQALLTPHPDDRPMRAAARLVTAGELLGVEIVPEREAGS